MPPDPSKPKPNEYIEDGIVYVKEEGSGWAYFDAGGTLDDDEDTETPVEVEEDSEEL